MIYRYNSLWRSLSYVFSFFVIVSFFGCAAGIKETKIVPEDIIYETYTEPQVKYEGSLWQSNGPLSSLFSNPKAGKIGDVVTIRIVETSSASNNASTNTERNSSLLMGMNNFFGMEKKYPTDGANSHPFFNPFAGAQANSSNSFEGTGSTARSGQLTAYITARIIEVVPNGDFKIRGTREVTVNNETQLITLSGIIRSRDISSNNEILSTYISDARIAYSGSGIINDKQRPGWLSRLLDIINPF